MQRNTIILLYVQNILQIMEIYVEKNTRGRLLAYTFHIFGYKNFNEYIFVYRGRFHVVFS